eukprot:TRINITY_DN8258_c0_g1_i1.p1 TRINITY_DN8258_c0_g1~~TRINITY_DN8258_c0_g1_i1.p1  ORF type:complete len:404 (-),score=63.90 TRINITY_DN8258_c0_g1_i1:25-1197(-)
MEQPWQQSSEGLLAPPIAPFPGMGGSASSSSAGPGRSYPHAGASGSGQVGGLGFASGSGQVGGLGFGQALAASPSGRGRGPGAAQRTASACTDPQEQQCAEEECDPEECGDEARPPADGGLDCLGNDRRPYLPLLLFASTLIGAIHMLMLEFPLMRENLSWGYSIRGLFLAAYVVTLGCMVYCVLCDPGKLASDDMEAFAQMHPGRGRDYPLPKRCHKMWLFKQPIRRYDHYCRWLTNAIGLLNHREFVVMLVGLTFIGVGGCLVDFVLVATTSSRGRHFFTGFMLIGHLTYSFILAALAFPILRIHTGFISRNELANEWKQNTFYVLPDERTGKIVPVSELDEETFNEGLDNDRFVYDPSRNSMDNGWMANCTSFWCVPRWARGELGQF